MQSKYLIYSNLFDGLDGTNKQTHTGWCMHDSIAANHLNIVTHTHTILFGKVTTPRNLSTNGTAGGAAVKVFQLPARL